MENWELLWFLSSVRTPPTIMNRIMEGPYVTRKYGDDMIEGAIVGIGKDGAK